MWRFGVRIFFRVGDYRYFREIAEFMKIKVPLINHEIGIDQHTNCIVHGLKRIEQSPLELPQTQLQTEIKEQTQEIESKEEIEVKQPQYVFEQHSKLKIGFKDALEISKDLDLDLCLIRTASQTLEPILNVSPVCRNIYSEYYQTHIKKKGKNSYKTFRFSDRINSNDMKTKYNNIIRLRNQGERRFKLQASSDTDKAAKVLIQFGQMFGKKVSPQLKTIRIPPRYKEEQRWNCMLVFDEEIKVDSQKVNKKWRRFKFQASQQQIEEDLEDLDDEANLQMQRQLYNTYKEMGIKMSPKFQQLADLEEKLKTDKHAIFREAASNLNHEPEYEWDQEEDEKFAEKDARFNKEFFGERSAEQILQQMRELKQSGYESQAFKVARFRQLKAELEALNSNSDEKY